MIADYLAANLVNRVFDFPKLYTGTETLMAVYAYALQIYYDFSGYTDIALGSALLLGIKLPQNFNRSLRGGKRRRFLAPMAHHAFQLAARLSVFFAARQASRRFSLHQSVHHHGDRRVVARRGWNFVIWGALHGVGLVVVRLWQINTGTAKATGVWRYVVIFADVPFRRLRLDFFPRAEL